MYIVLMHAVSYSQLVFLDMLAAVSHPQGEEAVGNFFNDFFLIQLESSVIALSGNVHHGLQCFWFPQEKRFISRKLACVFISRCLALGYVLFYISGTSKVYFDNSGPIKSSIIALSENVHIPVCTVSGFHWWVKALIFESSNMCLHFSMLHFMLTF